MKTMKALFYAVSVMIAFTGCNSIDLQTEELNAPQEWKVSIQATKGDASGQTKALSESGSTITASWEAGDVVYILDKNGNQYGQMTAQSSGTSTSLIGTITRTMTVGKTYTLRYVQNGSNFIDLRSQNGSFSDIAHNFDLAESSVTVKSVDGYNVTFNETNVHFESRVSITKFTFDRKIVTVDIFSTNLKAYDRIGYSINYNFIDVIPTAETQTVYVVISTMEAKKAVFLFLAKDKDGLYYTAAKKAQLENGKNYETNVTLAAMPEYVDLGIVRDEKHVCWATKNVGASSPGEVGNYYAWAETSSKSKYSWDNYAYGSYSWVTKYDPDRPDQGVVDGLASLLPEDDAATVALGSGWRTPRYNDFLDLLNSSNTEVMTAYADGRWGYAFHSKIEGYAGKFIFIPHTSGYYEKDALTTADSYGERGGYYWSNTIDQLTYTSSSYALIMEFTGNQYNSQRPETSRMQRAYGLAVRPVYVH